MLTIMQKYNVVSCPKKVKDRQDEVAPRNKLTFQENVSIICNPKVKNIVASEERDASFLFAPESLHAMTSNQIILDT